VIRVLLLVSWLTACGSSVPVSHATTGTPILYIRSNVGDAELYIDGRFVAPLDRLGGGVAVAIGTHRIELRHEEFFSSYLEVQMVRTERKRIAVAMAPILP